MNPNLTTLLITAGALYATIKYGPAWAKGIAFGAAGYMIVNNIPVVQNGLQVRLVAPAAAAA